MSHWDVVWFVIQFTAGRQIGTSCGVLGVALLGLVSTLIMPSVGPEKQKPPKREKRQKPPKGVAKRNVPWWVVPLLLLVMVVVQF
ncbi:hypothetical protein [Streptomyces geranii]|uniref:hypothetical protein n=1 Tax=Streptomyces geranii TaxID=2058923 RepID=UPI0013001EB2|nr:hypothetical protein [Streptomyces geranii]